MNTSKAELLSYSGFYVAGTKAYMPTKLDTEAGYFIDREPVRIFDAFDTEALSSALEDSLSHANTVIPTPERAPDELVLSAYLNVRSQTELEKKTVYISVKKLDIGFLIEGLRRKPDGTWARGTDKDIDECLPLSTSYEQLSARVIEYLRTRKDLKP